MGYESRVYVIRKTEAPVGTTGKLYGETMAVYNMGKFPPFQRLFNRDGCPASEYAPCEGDDDITEDMYKEPLRERSLAEVIECLEGIINGYTDEAKYARIRPLLAMLRAYQGIENDWYRLAVLHYGM